MVKYDDLPKELRKLFGNSNIPPETRESISHDWDKMDTDERQQLISKLQEEQDPLKRILVSEMDCTKKLLS